MAGFDLSNYKTVPERITEAKAKYPQGSFQTELLILPLALADRYVAVKARFFRFENDPHPGEGVAWEVVPGKTPYTKDSELQNAETSAWGRALVAAFAVDASKGIASREEVESRQPEPRPRSGGRKVTPTPEPQENHKTAPVSDLKPNVASEVARMKRWAVEQLGGDVGGAAAIWSKVLETYELDGAGMPRSDSLQFVESDLSIAVGEALTEELVNP